jgi:hypothetical protein
MKYQCIKCNETWGEGTPEKDGYSHGLCLYCLKEALIPLYRRRQMREGNFDCFGRSSGFCDQNGCKYRAICLQPVMNAAFGAKGQGSTKIDLAYKSE